MDTSFEISDANLFAHPLIKAGQSWKLDSRGNWDEITNWIEDDLALSKRSDNGENEVTDIDPDGPLNLATALALEYVPNGNLPDVLEKRRPGGVPGLGENRPMGGSDGVWADCVTASRGRISTPDAHR